MIYSSLKLNKADVFVYASVLFFILDNIYNSFFKAPIFVLAIPFLILLTIINIKNKKNLIMVLFLVSIVVISYYLNFFRFGFSIDSSSDILFVMLTLFTFAAVNESSASERCLDNSFWLLLMLFLPAFLGFNGRTFGDSDVFESGSTDIEYFRVYNQGFYRFPHTAAYVLALGAIWWSIKYQFYRKNKYIIFSIIFISACLYTGSRTPIFAFLIGVLFNFFRPKILNVIYILISISTIIVFLYNIDLILEFFNGTIFYQYLTIFVTIQENYERLSRYMIWNSWLEAVKEFNVVDYLIGHSYGESLKFNENKLDRSIWFHNDYLSFFYSYGILFLLLYIKFIFNFFKNFFKEKSSFLIRCLVFFIIISAFLNGFYKYMPMLFLFVLSYYRFHFSKRS